MVRTTFTGQEIVSVLTGFGHFPKSHRGIHVRLRYEHPETDEVRNDDVPLHDEVAIGTLKSIADQCGANGFYEWCQWIDEHS